MPTPSGAPASHDGIEQLVDDTPRLTALAERLSSARYSGLDTEFMRERTDRAQLCLIQVTSEDDPAWIDPLALPDLEPLRAPLTDPAICKIMHAARQDLEVLWPHFGRVAPVFDTQVAAALAGMPAQVGYGELVRRQLGVELSKGQTRTDWTRRPLSPAQVAYARDDVRYLAPLRESLLALLDKLDRLAWLHEELADIDTEELAVDPERAYERMRGFRELDPHRLRLAQKLAAWRERRASERDRPRGWILDEVHLRDIVMRAPRTTAELAQIEGIPAGFVEHSGPTVLRIIGEADLPAQLPPRPRPSRPDPEVTARVKQLGNVLRARATELGLQPEILATRRELEQLVQPDAGDAPDLHVLKGWRRSVIGDELLAAARAG